MEFEFINDPITGSAKANFSLEHEIIGPWLEVEVGQSADKLTELLTAIADVSSGKCHEIMIAGHEYSVEISEQDVIVQNNASLNGTTAEVPVELSEEFDNFDQNSMSSCGLEDFRNVLKSWARFTQN